jgi:cell division protease FtsH
MVCEWGMSGTMGPLTFGKKEEQIFLGREIAQHQDYSEDTAHRIDQEVKRFVTENYNKAYTILTENKKVLLDMAEALLQLETLDAEQVKRIVAGLPADEPAAPPPSGTPEGHAQRTRPRKRLGQARGRWCRRCRRVP